ncbi:uncharacterized protein LOC126418742 [Schistocerca serialis cubense]|uniref:uncharacterized protein LOC126418742 n=1 Tax=Schistocerca serialis cubense TaxID=2023355 RepID=UPI00214E49D7|nr:uncharacterized protein LOC126418742 [Schistocerca serialis cubense]
MSIKEQTPPEEDTHGDPKGLAVTIPHLANMNAVLALVILGAVATASVAAVPTTASPCQVQQKQQPVDVGNIGVFGVSFGVRSFSPTVNVNNTSYLPGDTYYSGYEPSTQYSSVGEPTSR